MRFICALVHLRDLLPNPTKWQVQKNVLLAYVIGFLHFDKRRISYRINQTPRYQILRIQVLLNNRPPEADFLDVIGTKVLRVFQSENSQGDVQKPQQN